jgi:hypothetical protein
MVRRARERARRYAAALLGMALRVAVLLASVAAFVSRNPTMIGDFEFESAARAAACGWAC